MQIWFQTAFYEMLAYNADVSCKLHGFTNLLCNFRLAKNITICWVIADVEVAYIWVKSN